MNLVFLWNIECDRGGYKTRWATTKLIVYCFSLLLEKTTFFKKILRQLFVVFACLSVILAHEVDDDWVDEEDHCKNT